MRKFKVYLDTSALSYLSQDDAPEKMRDTLEFWDDVKSGVYDIVISAAVVLVNVCRSNAIFCLSDWRK
jgi:predicted nucleic acid-binding protein